MSGKQQQKKGGGDVCANPGCSKIGGGFKRCERCQRVKYCSGKCSKAHWKNGHKKQCKSWTAQNARDAARGSVSGEGAGAGAIAEPPSMKASNSPECILIHSHNTPVYSSTTSLLCVSLAVFLNTQVEATRYELQIAIHTDMNSKTPNPTK